MRSKFGTFAKTANFHAFTPFDQTLNCKLNLLLHLDALADAPSLTPKQLATKHGDEAARWAQLQLELRKRAIKKFGELSTQMLFEREALEQATSLGVARYHAGQFPQGAPVIDLTAGLGGDTLALAERGPVVAYENDPTRAELLQFNLKTDSTAHTDVKLADGLSALLNDATPAPYIWADPDRRAPDGRRLTRPEDYSPDPAELAAKLKDCKLAGIKLSPLLPDEYLESLGGSLEFISYQGECLEAVVWLGTENTKPKRQAVILKPNLNPIGIEASDDYLAATGTPKEFIHDCDPAVVRAHCLPTFGFHQLGNSVGYLTSDSPKPSPGYRTYRVLATTTQNKVKAELRKLDAYAFEIKQRGTKLDPARMLKELGATGKRPISLISFSFDKHLRLVLTEQLG